MSDWVPRRGVALLQELGRIHANYSLCSRLRAPYSCPGFPPQVVPFRPETFPFFLPFAVFRLRLFLASIRVGCSPHSSSSDLRHGFLLPWLMFARRIKQSSPPGLAKATGLLQVLQRADLDCARHDLQNAWPHLMNVRNCGVLRHRTYSCERIPHIRELRVDQDFAARPAGVLSCRSTGHPLLAASYHGPPLCRWEGPCVSRPAGSRSQTACPWRHTPASSTLWHSWHPRPDFSSLPCEPILRLSLGILVRKSALCGEIG